MRTHSSKWLIGSALAGCLAASPALAQVIVVVDDVPGNDSAYVDGVGGNFSGAGALVAAELAIEGDSLSAGTLFDINIIDTDGVQDTYSGSITFSDTADRSIRVQQVANGNGNDTSVVLVGTGGGVAFMAQGPGTVLKGISPALPLIIEAGPPGIGTGTFAGGANARFENLLYRGAGALDHNDFDGGAGSVVFQSCTFGIGNGPQIFRDGTVFNDCQFLGGGFKFVMLAAGASAITINDSHFGPAGGGLHLGGSNSNIILNDCTFNTENARLLQAGVIGTNQTITFNDPVFTGKCGDVMLGLEVGSAAANPTVNIVGTDPLNKVDLDPAFNAGTVLFARIYAGTINLVNVTCSVPNAHIDDLGNPGVGGTTTIGMDGCYWPNNNTSGSVNFVNSVDPPADPNRNLVFNLRNTIWAGGTPFGAYIDATRPHTGTTTFNMEHCTMVGSTGNTLVGSTGPVTSTQTLNSDYSIFDSTQTVSTFASGVVALVGERNIVNGAGFGPGMDPSTLFGATGLDALGRITAGSVALENAIGSTLAFDIDGEVRPSAGSTHPDIGADESEEGGDPFIPGWPIQAVRIPNGGTAPTIDGVVNPATEYAPTGVPIPMIMALSTLNANNPYFPDLTHQGTTLNVTGDFFSDGDGRVDAYFVYDASAFYFGAVIMDESLNPNTNPQVNAGDCFQLCMDFDNSNAVDGQVDGTGVYIPSYAAATATNDPSRFQQFWPSSSPNPFTGATYAVQTNAEGYTVEARIPWSVITSGDPTYTPTNPFPPADGQVGGMMPLLDDHDGGINNAIAFMYSAGAGANIIVRAASYNDLLFVESPTLPTSVQDWSMY